MSASANELKLAELKDTISQLNSTLEIQNQLLESLKHKLELSEANDAEKTQIIKNLRAEIEYLKQRLFGSSSERSQVLSGQLSLFDDPEEDFNEIHLVEAEFVKAEAPKRNRKRKATYDEIFAGIKARKVYVDTLTDEQKRCPECGTDLVPVGHEHIRTELIYHPASLERIDYISTTYTCPKCKEEHVETGEGYFIKDEGKPALIPGSYASESIAAWTMYQKFCNSMPYYRQAADMNQYGVKLQHTTLANWAIYCTRHYFSPLYDFFHRQLLKRKFLMADETPIQVLKEEGRRPQTKSYIWLMRSGEDGLPPIILYNYTPTRAGENAAAFLSGIAPGTYLMVDGYQGYNKVPGVKLTNCWAHVRRYLFEAIPKGHENDYAEPAVQGFLYVEKLFYYEGIYQEKGLSCKQRYKKRLKDEKPVLEAFWSWFDKQKPVRNSRLDRACTYIRNRRQHLSTYLEDGRCSFHNNLSENSIRPFTVGRKNWLFSDTPNGAEANAVIYTMVEMAKAYGLNTYQYLRFLLESRPNDQMSDEELEHFAPWNPEVQKVCCQENEVKS